jgi:Zn-dependent M32 family carboxypeptidase
MTMPTVSPPAQAAAAYGPLTRVALAWTSRAQRKGPMASLTKRIMKFVQSPQGRQVIERAKVEASKPENRRKIEQLRRRYLDKRR